LPLFLAVAFITAMLTVALRVAWGIPPTVNRQIAVNIAKVASAAAPASVLLTECLATLVAAIVGQTWQCDNKKAPDRNRG
jgi:hypothetical protein